MIALISHQGTPCQWKTDAESLIENIRILDRDSARFLAHPVTSRIFITGRVVLFSILPISPPFKLTNISIQNAHIRSLLISHPLNFKGLRFAPFNFRPPLGGHSP